jgi:hypothetical protein
MGRRLTTRWRWAMVLLLLAGAVIAGSVKFFERVGITIPLLVLAGSFILYFSYRVFRHRRRLSRLESKYKDANLVRNIMDGYFWVGQTAEQLGDALGAPADVDKQVLKTKSKEIWKYAPQGRNRYALRITLQNGTVVGWDQKD